MLDSDLAVLYRVATKRLNEQVRRNIKRFSADFMYRLSREEFESLRSHFATIKIGRVKHRKYLPYIFTEQGIAMLSAFRWESKDLILGGLFLIHTSYFLIVFCGGLSWVTSSRAILCDMSSTA
jgi:hypothetical protein